MSQETHILKRAIFVASSAPYWKRWSGLQKLGMFFNVNIMIPAACFGRKVFPAKAVGFSSMNMPASIAKTWVSWMKTPGYLFDDQHGYDISRYKTLNFPILSLGFSDDHYAPKINIDKLLSFFQNCSIENTQIDASQHGGIAHMGYFHDRHKETLWKDAIKWLEQDK
jgi:predicted alpha/beta hydrolase